MSRRPVYDPQVAARSWALSTHADYYTPPRRYVSARHFVSTWLKLEALVASARSSLGYQLEAMELGWVEIGGQAPSGYEPADDLVECREILRYCITSSLESDAWGEMGLARPMEMWTAWWLLRVRGGSERDVCGQVNTRIKAGELSGVCVSSPRTMAAWALKCDAVVEGELYGRRTLVRNVVKEVK